MCACVWAFSSARLGGDAYSNLVGAEAARWCPGDSWASGSVLRCVVACCSVLRCVVGCCLEDA